MREFLKIEYMFFLIHLSNNNSKIFKDQLGFTFNSNIRVIHLRINLFDCTRATCDRLLKSWLLHDITFSYFWSRSNLSSLMTVGLRIHPMIFNITRFINHGFRSTEIIIICFCIPTSCLVSCSYKLIPTSISHHWRQGLSRILDKEVKIKFKAIRTSNYDVQKPSQKNAGQSKDGFRRQILPRKYNRSL